MGGEKNPFNSNNTTTKKQIGIVVSVAVEMIVTGNKMDGVKMYLCTTYRNI